MNLNFCLLLSVLLVLSPAYADDQAKTDDSTKENDLIEDRVGEELTDEDLKKETKIEYLNKVDNCKERAKTNDFLSLHFTLKWLDGEKILST